MIKIEIIEKISCKTIEPKDCIEKEFCQNLNKEDNWYFAVDSTEEVLIIDESGNYAIVPDTERIAIKIITKDDWDEIGKGNVVYCDY